MNKFGVSKGYGFVRFGSEYEQQHALSLTGQMGLGSRSIKVKPRTTIRGWKGSGANTPQSTPAVLLGASRQGIGLVSEAQAETGESVGVEENPEFHHAMPSANNPIGALQGLQENSELENMGDSPVISDKKLEEKEEDVDSVGIEISGPRQQEMEERMVPDIQKEYQESLLRRLNTETAKNIGVSRELMSRKF